jgi:hypothetical protein
MGWERPWPRRAAEAGTHFSPEVTVALQGTLDTFALADVLRLLAATTKTGRLRVTGDRGSGSVWVSDGRVVATELAVPGASDDGPAHTLFALLRFAAGSFTFESGAAAPRPGSPQEVEPLLGEAELLLDEWRSIEAVVPSLDAWLTLQPDLENDVVVDGPRWKVIAAVGGGNTAGAVGEILEAGELAVLRSVKELVELGLLEVGDRPVSAIAPAGSSFTARPHEAPHLTDRDPAPPSLAEISSGLGSVPLSRDDHHHTVDSLEAYRNDAPATDTHHTDRSEPVGERPFVADLTTDEPALSELAPPPVAPPAPAAPAAYVPGPSAEPSLDDAAEIARQLANLSPRAAKAVAAAAKATTEEERDAALAAIEAEDDTVNRGLLLRFLGSVDS